MSGFPGTGKEGAESDAKEQPSLRAIDTAFRPPSAARDPTAPISPALNYHRNDSSHSSTSNGGTIPEYRADDGRYQTRAIVGLSTEGNMRERLPYSPSSADAEGVEGERSEQGRNGFSTSRGDTGHKSDGRLLQGVHKKSLRRTGLMSKPSPRSEDEWIKESDEVTEWLPLFYDLVVVAVLGTFTTQHEVGTPSAIPVFLSFFTIIFWTWCSQTAYDMRFQSNDSMHRFFKFLQVCLFIYQGASSGNWNPGRIEIWTDPLDSGDYGARLAVHQDALRSWLTVVVAFAVSRGLLTLQYAICAWQGRKVGRDVKHIYMTMLALLISLILVIVSAAIPSTSYHAKVAKIAIFYIAIIIELADGWVQVLLKISPAIPTHRIGERYGAFLLIVIGEGIIMISKAFNKAISGLSDDDSGTYIQVFLCIVVLYLLWSFLFSNFNKDDHTGSGRAAIWQTLHFPLTFGVLLLMSGMVNVVIVTSSTHGLSLVLEDIGNVALSANATGTLPVDDIKRANRYMYKLSLEPSFPQMIETVAELQQDEQLYLDRQTTTTPSDDWYIVLDQYVAQMIYNTFSLYGVEIPDAAETAYAHLYSVNTTYITNEEARDETRTSADEMLTEFAGDIIVDSFTGILWLLPVSGIVLILSALRSMAWYRFTGIAHYLIHLPQIIFGVALGLLGLLDIGPKRFNIGDIQDDSSFVTSVNPLYRVVFDEAPLVIVAVVYLVVWLITVAGLWWVERKAHRRLQSQHLGEKAEKKDRDRERDGSESRRKVEREAS